MNNTFYIFILFLFSTTLQAQTEHVHLQTDRTMYISGETIYYNCVLSSQMVANDIDWSRSMYTQLLNNKGLQVSTQIIEIRNGQASGAIKIPKESASGYYALHAETRWMRNNLPSSSSVQVLKIIQKEGDIQYLANAVTDSFSTPSPHELIFSCVDNNVSSRKKVKLRIPKKQKEQFLKHTRFSTSVVRKGSALKYHSLIKLGETNTEEKHFLPESQGMLISGKVITPTQNQNPIHFSFFNQQLGVYSEYPKPDGHFTFQLPFTYGDSEAFIYTDDTAEILKLDPQFRSLNLNLPNQLTLSNAEKETINRLHNACLIDESFNWLDATKKMHQFENFYDRPKHTVDFDQFIELPSLSEYIEELFPTVYLRTKPEGKILLFANPPYSNPIYEPLILIDKLKISNINNILSLNVAQISKIDVFDQNYILGNQTYSGIFSITTKNKDFAQYTIPSNGQFLKLQLYSKGKNQHKINESDVKDERKPLFRNTLFWKTGLSYDDLNDLSFYTGDEKGEFEIVITGISEKGERIEGRTSFTVE